VSNLPHAWHQAGPAQPTPATATVLGALAERIAVEAQASVEVRDGDGDRVDLQEKRGCPHGIQ